MNLVTQVHGLTAQLPASERFDLVSQMKRASRSVPANIAEGYARRRYPKEFVMFLTTAPGSANEMEVHLDIAADLSTEVSEECAVLRGEYRLLGRQLNRLIASWRGGPPTVPATSN